ncbi:hypothetical protein NQ314_005519 [Rhamnusium bicolor]|uniref:CTP synthase (glutamine hydrolyzing) n=1 Tax=Rhamnusium bicolor TaxID=1586634 RepID=A0AAV8ZI51_9CUCU|nr:hypothetical protein NQ314_005519 [Rhamnusium bicolor]
MVAIVGKYTRLEDSYISIRKALHHAGNKIDYKVNIKFLEASNLESTMLSDNPASYHDAWHNLCVCDCVVVPGGFGKCGVEGKIKTCKWCRVNDKPFLGICLGFQAAVIEFSRNVLKLDGANSTEVYSETKHPVVIDMPEHNTSEMGGTMRLGKRTTLFKPSAVTSKIRRLYGNKDKIDERHRHRYEVNPEYIDQFEKNGNCIPLVLMLIKKEWKY